MDLKTFATLALLGYTNAAISGVRNVDWPAWPSTGRLATVAGTGTNTYTATTVGSYPTACVRSALLARFP